MLSGRFSRLNTAQEYNLSFGLQITYRSYGINILSIEEQFAFGWGTDQEKSDVYNLPQKYSLSSTGGMHSRERQFSQQVPGNSTGEKSLFLYTD